MNDLIIRRQLLTQAEALLSPSAAASSSDFLLHVGQVYRVSCTDADASDEAASLVDQADALLEKLLQAARGRALDDAQLPELSGVHGWLRAPRGHFAEVLSALDRLGAFKAGLSLAAGGSALDHQADVATNELVRRIEEAAARSPGALFELGIAALERAVAHGIVPGEDRALLALDAVVQRRLSSALRGQPFEAPRSTRVRPLDAEQAAALGSALASAMQRSQPLRVAPDLLELSSFPVIPGSSRAFDLILHNAATAAPLHQSVELMRDVRVTVTDEEIEVELLNDEQGAVLLVPLVQGEPGRPCPSRSGNHPHHLVFTPAFPEAGLDGYALVVGDRLAFLRRQG